LKVYTLCSAGLSYLFSTNVYSMLSAENIANHSLCLSSRHFQFCLLCLLVIKKVFCYFQNWWDCKSWFFTAARCYSCRCLYSI